jgi:Protein of Unknown function (DUF2784)
VIYKILADVVVAVHFLWIVFLIFGGLLGVRHRAIKIFHVAGLLFAAVIQVSGWYCPLTDLEVWLKSHYAPGVAYRGSFIIHYVEKLVYIRISHGEVIALTILLCIFNGWVYLRKK